MPSATPPELQKPWRAFLSDVDRQLSRSIEIHCLGGFVAAVYYDLPRPITALFPGAFQRLRLRALDPHDLALSKLTRNSPIDRDDVAQLARAVPLDATLLRKRYQRELRPIIVGDLERHDRTLDMWIEAYFPP
jgi:hypothetical protein